ncbi:MAG: ATP-binding protein [Verrucomicrobiota bacterium]
MKEDHRTEWKERWRDDFLKIFCGLANSGGGRLVIGRDNSGNAKGVKDAARLLVDLPNKARDVLGIIVQVKSRAVRGKEIVEVDVPSYPCPISCQGEYYVRSGSTTQLLKGAALDRFLLHCYGRTWDAAPLPGVGPRQLSRSAFTRFRKLARQSRRVESAVLRESDKALLEKLDLTEGRYLKRAAVLLFHAEPEKFFTGAFVKTGFFRSPSDLVYHDEIRGDLFTQAAMTVEVLLAKYLKAAISYRGIDRVESLPVPEEALREALLNALIHRDYATTAPVQIRIYPDRLQIWNPGRLPEGWTLKKFLGPHASQPHNPLLAGAFFRAGEIEAWGRGVQRVFEACRQAGAPAPEVECEGGEVRFEFPFAPSYLQALAASPETSGKTRGKTREKTREKILGLLAAEPGISMASLASQLGLSAKGIEWQMRRLTADGIVRRVGPAKGGHWQVLET